jgi:hypothetical protein
MQSVSDILYVKGRRKERLILEQEEKRDKRLITVSLFKRYQKIMIILKIYRSGL